jgi:sialate O-acetylesterase
VILLLGLILVPGTAFGNGDESICHQYVAEASSYTPVYILDIPLNADYGNSLPPYSLDNTASIGTFDRVGYCLQLDDDWIWVSMDAFTTVPAQVGVPVAPTGAVFQQMVSNMNVASNVSGIVTGESIATGNIEFWHHCYAQDNEVGVPGASDSLYDFGDNNSYDGSCYGSMQVHNWGAVQTLFAYNAWD